MHNIVLLDKESMTISIPGEDIDTTDYGTHVIKVILEDRKGRVSSISVSIKIEEKKVNTFDINSLKKEKK